MSNDEKPTMEEFLDVKAKELVREMFMIFDQQEESDSGKTFHPTYISSCRVMHTQRLQHILEFLRGWTGVDKTPDSVYDYRKYAD